MEKGDIDILSGLLTEMKDALNELESSLKKKDEARGGAAKRRILDLQMQIKKKI